MLIHNNNRAKGTNNNMNKTIAMRNFEAVYQRGIPEGDWQVITPSLGAIATCWGYGHPAII